MNSKTRKDFRKLCQALHQRIAGELSEIAGEDTRRDYAFVLLIRLLFARFLQEQGLLDGDPRYLMNRLARCREEKVTFSVFLTTLVYGGFCTPIEERPPFVQGMLGTIPYLSGSLFPFSTVERSHDPSSDWSLPQLPDEVFAEVLVAFDGFSWTCEERQDVTTPEGLITPAFLGSLTEHHIADRKKTGSYYTPEGITTYIVRQTCRPCILNMFEEVTSRRYDSIDELIAALDARDCGLLLFVILPTIAILDPACGAADFLVTGLHDMTAIYKQIIDRALNLHYPVLDGWLQDLDRTSPNRTFALKKRVLSRNLYGVDIQQIPLDVAKLRLALSLLSEVKNPGEDMPLPNLEFALPRGNALIGLDRITEREHARLLRLLPEYDDLIAAKNAFVREYQSTNGNPITLAVLRARVDALRRIAYDALNRVLLMRLQEGRSSRSENQKRERQKEFEFTLEYILSLDPFHWIFDMEFAMEHLWWERLDGEEAAVVLVNGRLHARFGPERVHPSME